VTGGRTATAAELPHPVLTGIALRAVPACRREAWHAGGFVDAAGRGWLVAGPKESGKSTLLAAMALLDIPVIADDMLVLEGDRCLAGPRLVDLRPGARGLAPPDRLTPVRDSRLRLDLEPVAPSVPLAGIVALSWAQDIAVESVGGADRLRTIRPLALPPPLGPTPSRLLDHAARPVLLVRRPKDLAALTEVAHRVAETAARL
jgi:energy-coupling factor transporter ATP-binding protein EcfA2